MEEKKILIAGLPDAGKSSYIGALNGVMSQDGDFNLSPADEKPTEWTYLNSLTADWFDCQIVDHSSDGETKYIKWPLKNKMGQDIVITIPDMKGETYHEIINNDFDPKLADFCKGASGILFFVNKMNRLKLKEHAMTLLKEEDGEEKEEKSLATTREEVDKLKLNVANMPDVTKNLLVIRYLRQLMGNVKIVVAVSAWDEKTNYHTVEDYFKKVCPAIYNYVCKHFDEHRFYGISAQGAKYGQAGMNLKALAETGKRAYVFTTEKIYDISLPLDYLISEQ